MNKDISRDENGNWVITLEGKWTGEAGPEIIMSLANMEKAIREFSLPTDNKENIKDNPNKNAFRI